MIFVSRSVKETKDFAAGMARKILDLPLAKKAPKELLRNPTGQAKVVALEGELGAGKTTFIQGFVRALGVKNKIKSPTFVLLKKYSVNKKIFKYLYHIDCYRLRDHKDLIPLNIEEIFADADNIVLIEWAERVKKILPKKHIKIHIDHINSITRKIIIRMSSE